jgi:DNA repair exonuclease SbcCD ATPase subunit
MAQTKWSWGTMSLQRVSSVLSKREKQLEENESNIAKAKEEIESLRKQKIDALAAHHEGVSGKPDAKGFDKKIKVLRERIESFEDDSEALRVAIKKLQLTKELNVYYLRRKERDKLKKQLIRSRKELEDFRIESQKKINFLEAETAGLSTETHRLSAWIQDFELHYGPQYWPDVFAGRDEEKLRAESEERIKRRRNAEIYQSILTYLKNGRPIDNLCENYGLSEFCGKPVEEISRLSPQQFIELAKEHAATL